MQDRDYDVGHFPGELVMDDFNHDGKLDLVVANYWDHNVTVLIGDGTGRFLKKLNHNSFEVGGRTRQMVTGDFNGDGHLDLITVNDTNGDLSFVSGNGDGEFGAPRLFSAGGRALSVAVLDFNGDHRLDLAVGIQTVNTVRELFGDGAGGFITHGGIDVGNNPGAIISSDFNLDGKADLAVVNSDDNDIYALLGDGTGLIQAANRYSMGQFPVAILATDFNRDGKPDILTANLNSADVSLLLNAIVISPQKSLYQLIKYVEQLNLPHGIENALTRKLENAITRIENGRTNAAIMHLYAFICQVEAQRGKKITESDADYLVGEVQAIIHRIQSVPD